MRSTNQTLLSFLAMLLTVLLASCGEKYRSAEIGEDCSGVVPDFDPSAYAAACTPDDRYVAICADDFWRLREDCQPAVCKVYELTEPDPDTGKEIVLNAAAVCEGDVGVPSGDIGEFCDTSKMKNQVCNLDRTAVLECQSGLWALYETCPTRCTVVLENFDSDHWFPHFETKYVTCE